MDYSTKINKVITLERILLEKEREAIVWDRVLSTGYALKQEKRDATACKIDIAVLKQLICAHQ